MALVYLNNQQFREDFDQTDKYTVGRRLQIDCGVDGVFYSHVTDSSYSGDVTTVTVADAVVTGNLTTVQVGVVSPGASGTLPVHTHASDKQGGTLETLPDQTSNSGRFLRTDGMEAYWDDLAAIERPATTSPLNGATGVLLTPTISLSPYYSLYGKTQQAMRIQISTDAFNTTVVDETLGAVSEYTPSSNLSTLTGYDVRAMYQDDGGIWSDWTPIISFTTADIYIEQPTVTNPTSGGTGVGETPTFTTNAFLCINGSDTHASSSWWLYRTSDESLIWSSVNDTSNLESIALSPGVVATSTEYRLEAVHTGTTYGDSAKGTSTYTTAASFFDYGPGDDYAAMVSAGNYDDTTDTGYMGLVTSTDLCDGTTLAADIGLSAGTAFNTTTGWLKFYVGATADCNKDGVSKVLFIAKETLRYDLSWDDIYLAGAVYGTDDNGVASASTGTTATQDAQVTYSGSTFKVRLLTGSATDPAAEGVNSQSCADDAGGGSEWNDLFYRVHTAVPTCTDATIGMEGGGEATQHGGPQDAANWANFTNAELQVFYGDAGDGTFCWCQEQGADASRRVLRGGVGLAYFATRTADFTNDICGWRPCLELVQA